MISKELSERIEAWCSRREDYDRRIADGHFPEEPRTSPEDTAAIRALLTAAQGQEWRPIAEAPSDGRSVLVIGGRHEEPIIMGADGDWWRSCGPDSGSTPTHWMPLPLAPQAEGEGS